MEGLIRKFGLFYLTTTGTFFLLCAYSLASGAPNYPFVPAMFLPAYLSVAVAMSERESGDPLLAILPIAPGEIVRVKLGLALGFVVCAWLSMAFFTALQGLSTQLAASVIKLNTISGIVALMTAGAFQLGGYRFGWPAFHKAVVACAVFSSVFALLFLIIQAERGHDYVGGFPLIPFLESVPAALLAIATVAAAVLYWLLMRAGPWYSRQRTAD